MQYDCALDRQGLTSLADNFLQALGRADKAAALGCLHDTAYFCVQTHFLSASGREAISPLLDRYRANAGPTEIAAVQSVVDAKNGRVAVACSMRWKDAEPQENTLFLRIRGDKVQDVHLYLSGDNPFA